MLDVGRHHQQRGLDRRAAGAARPVRHGDAAEAVRDEQRRRGGGPDRPVERLHPLRTDRIFPVPLHDATEVRVGLLPQSLPVLRTGVAPAGHDEDGRAHGEIEGTRRRRSCASWTEGETRPGSAVASRATLPRTMARAYHGCSGRIVAGAADLARPVAHVGGVGDRREHDAPVLRDALLVPAPAPADDAGAGAAYQQRRGALEGSSRVLSAAPNA